MKKRIFFSIAGLLVIIGGLIFWLNQHILTFYYTNPYTGTESFPYIATTIKKINGLLDKARSLSASDGYKYNIVYSNAYGSGFIRNNPIPNDLDFDVFIDLGTFDADKMSKHEIAEEMVNKMDSFQYSLVSVINMEQNSKKEIFTYRSPSGQFELLKTRHNKFVAEIETSLENAMSQEKYINHLTKMAKDTGEIIYYMPYVMEAGKLIVKDYDLLMMYDNTIKYNTEMPQYLRELSMGLAFKAKVKQGGKVSTIELVPELFSTGPLGLANRLYAPNVFFYKTAHNYLKTVPEMINDENFFKSIVYCTFDHILVIYPQDGFRYNPLKAIKRLVEIVDMIEPLLPESDVEEVYNIASEAWGNRDIVLLNEFNNIAYNLNKIYTHPILFTNAMKNGDIKKMVTNLDKTLSELKTRNNLSDEYMKVLENYRNNTLNQMLTNKDYMNLKSWQKASYDRKYRFEVSPIISKAVLSQIKNVEKFEKHIDTLRKICENAGYRHINIYIADAKTIELEEDAFTKGIKDFKDFARKNDLADDMDYKVLPVKKIPSNHLKYDIWVRYNTTKEQDAYFEDMKTKLINSRKSFKVKRKSVFVF